ncbi:MAG: hypothetical protein K9M57_02275 [Phycisphaerae bacterium]|nr:hypothetical protein [Phycisphaerae bacterium]
MIEFKCDKCNHPYKVSDEHAGKKIRCKKCGHRAQVPAVPSSSDSFHDTVQYAKDGITPVFDEIFNELLKQEQNAPTVEYD